MIATNDVMFAHKDDYDIHETKVCIIQVERSMILIEKIFSSEQYFKSSDEMYELFEEFEEVLSIQMKLQKDVMFP